MKMHVSHTAFALVFILTCSVAFSRANAAVSPAGIFADNMVLQRSLPVPIWGSADAGATVTVQFDGQTKTAIADKQGQWKLSLAAMKASAVGRDLLIQAGDDRVVLRNVLVGEVWFAGGQSNMAYTTGAMAKRLPEGKAMVAAASFKTVRLCKISEGNAPTPKRDLSRRANWQPCTPQTVAGHSAVAFVFARRLHLELNVPVGLIDCSWGGTPIEPYIPASAFTGHPTLENLATLAKAGDMEAIKKLPGGTFARSPAWLAGAIYNGRIAPVAPYAIRGALWYQGESNSGRGEDPRDYAHKMRALIKGWRASWNRDDLPVYFVQLPQWKSYAWTYLREEQRRSLDVKHTGMAVTIDLDNANDIHPPNKIDVGERLARWPLAKLYEKMGIASGPMYRAFKVQGNKAVIEFENVADGLMAGEIAGVTKVVEAKHKSLNGFEVADNDGTWHNAQAVIEDDRVIVSSEQVKTPVAVRYACHPEAPKGKPWNLYNKAGLPASPFCTDWSLMPYDPAKNPMPR